MRTVRSVHLHAISQCNLIEQGVLEPDRMGHSIVLNDTLGGRRSTDLWLFHPVVRLPKWITMTSKYLDDDIAERRNLLPDFIIG